MALEQGCIIWIEVLDPNGQNPKTRPLVVITATSEIASKAVVAAVAVSTKISRPAVADEVPLPWSPSQDPITGLYAECVAKCRWVVPVDKSKITKYRGPIDSKLIARIKIQVNRFVPLT